MSNFAGGIARILLAGIAIGCAHSHAKKRRQRRRQRMAVVRSLRQQASTREVLTRTDESNVNYSNQDFLDTYPSAPVEVISGQVDPPPPFKDEYDYPPPSYQSVIEETMSTHGSTRL